MARATIRPKSRNSNTRARAARTFSRGTRRNVAKSNRASRG